MTEPFDWEMRKNRRNRLKKKNSLPALVDMRGKSRSQAAFRRFSTRRGSAVAGFSDPLSVPGLIERERIARSLVL